MAAILKQQLEVTDRQVIKLPQHSTIISVQEQNYVLCLWFFGDVNVPVVERKIRIVGTGHELPSDFLTKNVIIGTVQSIDGFVWHVFEEL